MRERPRLEPLPERLGGGRAHLVRAPALEQLGAAEGDAEVRAVELVRRADEHVGAERGRVDRCVRRVVHGVCPGERAGVVRQLDDAVRVGQRARGVRGEWEGDDPRPLGELPLEVVEVERRVVADVDEADRQVEIVGELEPGRDVCVVIEPRHEDLVAGRERSADRAGEHEVERRHVLAEDRLVGLATQEVGGREPGLGEQGVAAPAATEAAAEVRVRLAQVGRDGVDHRVGALRAAGPVEERGRSPQRGEVGADGLDVERGRAHWPTCGWTHHRSEATGLRWAG